MQRQYRKLRLFALGLVLAVVALANAIPEPALAQNQPTEQQILDALKPRGATRSIGPRRSIGNPRAAEDGRFIDGLRTRSTRSLTIVEREKVAEIARNRPSIDLEIYFEFNSDKVGASSVPVLLALGRALSADELKGTVFLINGHTDAKGSADYNQDLSERRAEAVKRLLVQQFGLPVDTLVAIGYGKSQLKNSADPFAGENRRVQIVNTEHRVAAAR